MTVNATNNEASDFTIDPGASGDSFVQFDINGTGEFRVGVDDDASDAFKISQGSALGTNDTFVMTEDGERTMPLQPAVGATLVNPDNNITGDGTVATLVFDNEVFDQGGNFNTGTGVFTAPVTGRYLIQGSLALNGITGSHDTLVIRIVTSNRGYSSFRANATNFAVASGQAASCPFTAFCDMDAADTASITVQVSGGSLVVDAEGSGVTTAFCYCGFQLKC